MWIAQDSDGKIFTFEKKPTSINIINPPQWLFGEHKFLVLGKPNKDWQYSLINLDVYDYKIIDGILTKIDRINSKTPRAHAELACKYFMDDSIKIQYKRKSDEHGDWEDIYYPSFFDSYEYREKPAEKQRIYRNYIKIDGSVGVCESRGETLTCTDTDFAEWLGSWERIDND